MGAVDNRHADLRIKDKTVLKTLAPVLVRAGRRDRVASTSRTARSSASVPITTTERYTKEELGQYELEKDGVEVRDASQGSPRPLPARLQEAGLLPQPHQVSAQAGRLGPEGRPGSTGPGGRNTQNRGKSKYVRISWDEATTIIADEIRRIHKEYGPLGVLRPRRRPRRDQDGPRRPRGDDGPSRAHRRLHPGRPQRGQLGGLVLGHQARLGQRRERSLPARRQHHERRHPEHRHAHPHRVRPRDHALGLRRPVPQQRALLLVRSSARSRSSSPPTSTTPGAVHADKWIPILPNTDAALHLAIAYIWMTEGTYDKEYVATHVVGFDKFEDYVLGREDGVPKTPEWASAKMRRPRVDHQGAGPGMGRAADHGHALLRRLVRPRPLLPRAGPAGGLPARHAGPGQARASISTSRWAATTTG